MSSSMMRQQELKLLEAVKSIRDDPDLCDISFLVGPADEIDDNNDESNGSSSRRRIVRANSTILALRSPYFRAMCFGPMRRRSDDQEPRVIPDMEPDVFEKVLEFVHAREESLALGSLEEAWSVRYAASQFLMSDLVQVCDDYLLSQLTYKNALALLRQASAFRADDFRRKIFKVIRHRHSFILGSSDLKLLDLAELVDLVKLYRNNVKTDYIIKAISIWSEGLLDGDDDFKSIFCAKLFKHIRWDNLSNDNMLRLHDLKMLSLELENEAMISILARTGPIPEDEARIICSLELQVAKVQQRRPAVSRIFVRTLRSFQPGTAAYGGNGDASSVSSSSCNCSSTSVVLDPDGMSLLKDVLKLKPALPGAVVDAQDLSVTYSVNHGGKSRAENVRAVAYAVRHDNRDVFFLEVTFDGITLDGGDGLEGEGASSKDTDSLLLEVALAPELLRDLMDFNLVSGNGDVLTKIDKVSSEPLEVVKRFWQTYVKGKLVLCSDDSTPKYFFDGCGVPVVSQIN